MTEPAIHPAAQQELLDVVAYYDDIHEDLGAAFKACFFDYQKRIAANPLHFSVRQGIVRRVNLTPQFGEYYLPFMIWKDRAVILAVAHAKRRPYYGRKRVGELKVMF